MPLGGYRNTQHFSGHSFLASI